MSITSGAKSLIRAAFMPAAAILIAVALFFTATALQAKLAVDAAKADNATPSQMATAKNAYGLNIAACVTTWIAYAMLIVGAIIGGKQAKM